MSSLLCHILIVSKNGDVITYRVAFDANDYDVCEKTVNLNIVFCRQNKYLTYMKLLYGTICVRALDIVFYK